MALLSKVITAAPRLAKTGLSALRPITISAGMAPAGTLAGRSTPTEKVTVRPGSPALTVS
jgi:hypothetical protein